MIGSGSTMIQIGPFPPDHIYQNVHLLFVPKSPSHVIVLGLVHLVFSDFLHTATMRIWFIYSSFGARQVYTETLVLQRVYLTQVYLLCWARGLTVPSLPVRSSIQRSNDSPPQVDVRGKKVNVINHLAPKMCWVFSESENSLSCLFYVFFYIIHCIVCILFDFGVEFL